MNIQKEIFDIGLDFKTVLKAEKILNKKNIVLYLKNTGANAIVNVSIEISPDNKNYCEIITSMKNNLNAGEMSFVKLENCAFNFVRLRCQANDNAQTNVKAWCDAN